MKINNLDLLHHKILVGKSQGGDVTEYEATLHRQLRVGVKNKCPLTLDFINRLNAQKPLILKPSFIQRHRQTIIKYCEPAYNLTKWLCILSAIVMFLVEVFYA